MVAPPVTRRREHIDYIRPDKVPRLAYLNQATTCSVAEADATRNGDLRKLI